MNSAYATNVLIISCLAVPTVLMAYKALAAGRELKIRNKRVIEEAFIAAIGLHDMSQAVILKDDVNLGRKGRKDAPFEVYRVVHAPPTSWFAYTHVQGADPVLTPISEQRALIAVNS
ncbi:hypothetical protein [Pseudomonas lutea]|jgi:hypothetical protein|uniref:Uncharacterized protein n=1 Tax=Pseudomonas lutea TaxID=243924 RepID=A0A9X0JK65_9PSED|nr:hypothetical protein [Pseudomonas lutea]KGF65549.1 hypothetical protein LT42_06330 [Pseudomonas lutea]